jgi:aspartyl-tRNA(Asn)/glutamyl-tRNA(Gln) amidotransferase subunit A
LIPTHQQPPLAKLSRLLASGETTRQEVLGSRMKAISRHNGELNAFITVFANGHARRPSSGPLFGATLAIKDNVYLSGHRTTAGSRILRGFVPSRDADVITKLKSAGAVFLGKTNLHEFAYGVTNINQHFGDCRNPWDVERISGGSSGGSAVAVARGMACAAVGTDTAGSVRIPAALCGVVGYKPTYGLISRRGVVPLAWSLDTVGFLTRTVEDAALLAAVTAERRGLFSRRPKRTRLRGLKVGVPENLLAQLDEDIRRRYDEAIALAENDGAAVRRFRFLHLNEASACRNLVGFSEAASFHRQYFSKRSREYGADVRRRIAQGLAIPAAVYLDAQRARRHLTDYYRSIFRTVDFIALPTTRIPAPTIRASKDEVTAATIRRALLGLTESFNLFGAPAISIPCGLTREGTPVGLQLAGDLNSDDRLLSFAAAFERLLPRTLERIPFAN